jgi:ketosteroid isomerase-like protein
MSEESTTPGLVEAIRAMFEAGDRQALDSVMSVFGPDVVLDLSRLGLGTYRDHAAVREFVADWWGSYEEFENKPSEIIGLGSGVVLSISHQIARPVGINGTVERTDAYVFLFEAGTCVQWTVYPDIDEGHAAAERLAEERADG